jgi:large subunit ribosomal protein L3
MASGLIGKKLGMTQIFTKEGRCVPVTVIQAGPCTVLQKKTKSGEGYEAIQLGFLAQAAHRVNKPALGHFNKAGKGSFRKVVEFRVAQADAFELGQELNATAFEVGQRVAVTGTSKGRGFQGVIKRHHFGGGKETHGSMSHRRPGSIGQCAYPSRVFRGHRMEGQMGNKRVTVRNLEIMEVDAEQNLLLVKGAIPGANNNFVLIRRK